jgi:uncharacterized protein
MVSESLSIVDEAKLLVKDLMQKNDPSHDWFHVERVLKNAMFLAEQERNLNPSLNFDLEVIELAALFHGIL